MDPDAGGAPPRDPAGEGENPRPGHVFRAFAVAVVGVLVGVALVDVGVGRFGSVQAPESAPGLFLRDAELGWTNRPGFASEEHGIRVNSLGLRGPELPEDEAQVEALRREPRLLFCGASNIFGLGIPGDSIWYPRVEAAFAETFDPPPRVLNGGVQGYSLIQASRRAMRLATLFEPDVLVLEVFPGRQALVDTSPAAQWTRVEGRVVPQDVVAGWPEGLRWIPARVHRLLMHSNLYRRARPASQLGGGAGKEWVKFMLTEDPVPEPLRPFLDATRAELTALVRFCGERGIVLRLALLIEPEYAADKPWNNYLVKAAAAGAPPVGTPKEEPPRAMLRWLEPTGAVVWDMSDVMYAIGAGWDEHVQKANLHWAAPGHGLVARGWIERLRAEGLVAAAARRRAAEPRSREAALGIAGEAVPDQLEGGGAR